MVVELAGEEAEEEEEEVSDSHPNRDHSSKPQTVTPKP
jgi:hypothetical protein